MTALHTTTHVHVCMHVCIFYVWIPFLVARYSQRLNFVRKLQDRFSLLLSYFHDADALQSRCMPYHCGLNLGTYIKILRFFKQRKQKTSKKVEARNPFKYQSMSSYLPQAKVKSFYKKMCFSVVLDCNIGRKNVSIFAFYLPVNCWIKKDLVQFLASFLYFS